MKNKKKIIIGGLCAFLVCVIALCGVSHLYFGRSVMATISEMAMLVVDRDRIYEQGRDYVLNLRLRGEENEKIYNKPDGVKMDVSYYSRYEHGMQVFYFNKEAVSDTLIIYVPGGGYLNNPLNFHWKIINRLAKETSKPVLMPVYPKLPVHTCEESYEVMTEFYLDVASREGVERIVLVGDSSGGAMSLVLAQLVRDKHPDVLQAEELILIAPWMDASMENEEIKAIEPIDPMLGLYGTIDIGLQWAGDRDVHDPMVSPIYGTFQNLGRITMFAGTRDMLCPDIEKFSRILTEQGIEHTLIVEKGLDHPYPLFPIPEADKAQELMIDIINKEA